MPHNMTVTVEDDLWDEMKGYHDVRWSAVMKEAAKNRIEAIKSLERLSAKSKLSEEEITRIAVALGKKVTGRK